jgi:DNA modification methylase
VIYFFTKQQKNYFNLDAIRQPFAESSIKRISQKTLFTQKGGLKQDFLRGNPDNGNGSRCNKMVQSLAKKYSGKFDNEEDPEAFGSPRARTQREKHSDNNCRTTSCLHDGRDPKDVHHPNGKNPGTVWDITTQPYKKAHFATFPLRLVRMPILAGCPENGTVLDPFGGSGTVGEFCEKNNRNAILFELNPEYRPLIEERTRSKVPKISDYEVET